VLVAVAKVAARVAEVAMVCTAMINLVGSSKISACTLNARARYIKMKLKEYILLGLADTACI
jgi:hypothetical protein